MSAPTLSEAELQAMVIQTARLYGWRCSHARPAMNRAGKWSTPVQGDVGVPDLLLARDGVVILAELKGAKGKLTPDQGLWIDALGDHGRLWRPTDWTNGGIQHELMRHR